MVRMRTPAYAPMLVTSGPLPPDDDRYAFEVKWKGLSRCSVGLAWRAATAVGGTGLADEPGAGPHRLRHASLERGAR
jgi:hypothetical protein